MKSEVAHAVADIEIMQYIINSATGVQTLQLFHQPILNASDPKVVEIQGDYSSLTVISTFSSAATLAVDATEVPHNLSSYCRALCQYISLVLATIAIIAGLYSLLKHFTTEGFNLFETNRVGALVWIGRPLLLVRTPFELQLIGNTTVLATTQTGFMQFVTKVLE
ncbi:hypothetical protein THRCLA_00578 [Thraustotheca clavata]|uniref:Transmembrane protein n=1 Tax=Thraustotheca clavata TaxID=74557 RepID=A0A1W0AB59_9STRA|nr:hypothetical protein THRCLA_00578 [Thraustotheca clavata]